MPATLSKNTDHYIGRFRVLQVLGRGSEGVVYLASDPKLDREVAIKTTSLGASPDPLLADLLVKTVGDAGPYALLAGLFLLSAIMGQVISNTATSLIIIPISIVAANQMGISVQPVLMCVCIACAGAFLTPVATPTNLMVMEPGAYKFTDYWKLGLPMLIWFFIIAVFLVPLIWPFYPAAV
jgi:di/tricarboxylate transporter